MRRPDDDTIKRLTENNKKISDLLADNERCLRDAGFNPPRESFAFDPVEERKQRIQIPTGYIRTRDYYLYKYGLKEICNNDPVVALNIAYNLEMTDFHNYILNRLGIYGPILAMMYKQATINVVSIIEALFKAFIVTLRQNCLRCDRYNHCSARISKKQHFKGNFKEQINVYRRLGVLPKLEAKDYDGLIELYDYRNMIHIMKADDNEYTSHVHSQKKYNQSITLLKKVDDAMKSFLLERKESDSCERFQSRR